MADLSKTIEIVFGGRNELSSTINNVEKDLTRLTYLSDPLAKVGESILKIDAAFAAMAIGGMAYAIKTAGEFSGKFGEITTLIKDTGEPIDQFRRNILEYSTTSVKSIDDINQAVYSAISAGVDYKNSITFVNEAEKLSTAGRADLGNTTKALISVLNAYGASTDQAGKYSDIMFTTVRLGQTTIEELSSSLSKVTGIAANTGVPFETLSAAIAALTVSGMPTAEAITGIKAALDNIIKPSGQAIEMAQSLGLEFNATALKTKGFEGVLKEVYAATGGNVEKMAQLFGSTEALNAVLVLASDKTGKFKDALKEMGNAAGATQEAYDKVANSFENVNQRLENSFKVTLITIGDKMLPEYGNIANGLEKIFEGIRIGIDAGAFDPLFKLLDDTGKSIATWLSDIGKAFPEALEQVDFSELINAFREFGTAFSELFQTDMSNPEELARVLQLVVNSIKSLVSITQGIGEVFAPIVNFAKITLEQFNSLDESTKTLIGNVSGLGLAFKTFGPIASLAMLALGSDTETATQVIRVAFAAIENGVNALKVGILALGLAFANAMLDVGKLLDYIPGFDNSEGIARATERVEILKGALSEAENSLEQSGLKVRDAFSGVNTEADRLKKTVENTPKIIDITATLKTQATGDDATEVMNLILRPDDYRRDPLIQSLIINPNEKNLAETVKKIEEVLPEEKKMLITPEIEIAKIKAQADIIQNAVEWKAKLNIAEVEAATKQIEAAFKSIDNTISTTGSSINSLFGTLADEDVQGSKKWQIEEAIQNQTKLQQQAAEQQAQMVQSQIKLNEARATAMTRGDALITINGEGLQPHLEAFMFEILSAIQIRANAEGASFLLGL